MPGTLGENWEKRGKHLGKTWEKRGKNQGKHQKKIELQEEHMKQLREKPGKMMKISEKLRKTTWEKLAKQPNI